MLSDPITKYHFHNLRYVSAKNYCNFQPSIKIVEKPRCLNIRTFQAFVWSLWKYN